MRLVRQASFVLAVALCLAAAPVTQPAYLAPDSFDFKALLGGPPANDSQEHKDEIAKLLKYQDTRTPEEVARCKSEEEVDVFAFSSVLGSWFNEKDLPETAKFMKDAYTQTKVVSNAAKANWNRPRPPKELPDQVKPCVTLEKGASFPSGHATRGVMWATLLSEIFPDKKDDLMARGKLIGEDRVIAGMHFPSDVAAGQKLGAEIAKRMLADADVKVELEKVKAECLADQATHK